MKLSSAYPPPLLSLLAHRLRWRLVLALTRGDYRVQELVALIKQPPNLVSYHLKRLRVLKLVKEHRSAADARDIYYALDLEKLRALYISSGQALHPLLSGTTEKTDLNFRLTGKRPRVLFLCTHNSARSQIAEALLRQHSRGQVDVFSGGSEPTEIHALTRKTLAEKMVPIGTQYAKHLNEFQGQQFDYIITVCDRVRETCPVFPGDPEQIHWSLPDPLGVMGEDKRFRAFQQTAAELTLRINYLLLMIQYQPRG